MEKQRNTTKNLNRAVQESHNKLMSFQEFQVRVYVFVYRVLFLFHSLFFILLFVCLFVSLFVFVFFCLFVCLCFLSLLYCSRQEK